MSDAVASAFARERARLHGLSYRMTGSLADAEDIVMDAFTRALERPPSDLDAPLGPWLTRVVVNLAKDRLRARVRRGYRGPDLPEALELPDDADDRRHGEARYGELESVTLAFFAALDALSPAQRAVLLLRDVLDHSVAETASLLGRSETYVKVAHFRARARMEAYDVARVVPTPETRAHTTAALVAFVEALQRDDVDTLTKLLVEGCVTVNDGGGVYHAAGKPVVGRDKTILFHRKIHRHGVPASVRLATINGLPALVVHFHPTDPRLATRVVVQVELAPDGRIRAVRSLLSPSKVEHLVFPPPPAPPDAPQGA